MKSTNSRALTILVVAGAVFLSSSRVAVLCRGADGHIAVEFAFHDHCEGDGADNAAGENGHEHGFDIGLRGCSSCDDEGLAAGEVTLSKSNESRQESSQPCCIWFGEVVNRSGRDVSYSSAACFSSYFLALDAVILII